MKRLRHTSSALPLVLALLCGAAWADDATIAVYKSPTCGCCGKWIEHLQANGFDAQPVDATDLHLVKSMAGIAPEQASCHTARIGDYVIEGHVPAGDIRRLLTEHPQTRGLTVPEMPLGSPGMEAPNPEHYKVLLIGEDGSTSVFAEH